LNNATTQLLGMGNLGLGYDQLQNQNMSTLGNLALGYGQLQNQSNQNDFGNLMGLAQFGNQQNMYNNALPGMQLGNAMTMLGMVPNSGPAPVDVTGAYGLNQQGQNLNYQGQVANANGQNQMMGALGSAAIMAMMMMSSRDLKDDEGEQGVQETLDAVMSLPLHRWHYKGDDRSHIGTFAEDFHEALGLPESPAISAIDMFGALLGAVQAIGKRLEKLESKISSIGELNV